MVYVVIPNFNGKHHLETCLPSLINQTFKNFKIIVVDNASNDDSLSYIEKFHPDVFVIKLDANFGFAKAVNIGIIHALKDNATTHIVLANNDIEFDENFLYEMLQGFENENIGSVSAKMINFYKRDIIDDAGNFVSKKSFPIVRGHGEKDKGQYDTKEYIFGACAGAAIYKKEVFINTGLFDEDFFAYLEDVDFSFRMQLKGYKCLYNYKAICYHKRGGTFSQQQSFQTYLMERNMFVLRVKNFPVSVLLKYFFYYILHFSYRIIKYFIVYSPKISYYGAKGFFNGLLMIPKLLGKRFEIQRSRNVNNSYILSFMK